MEKIVWDQSLSVGLKEIGLQHQQLVNILNDMIDLQIISVGSEKISDTLTKMTEYKEYHFGAEENLMQQYGYPDYETHRREHIEFMRKTAQFAMGAMDYRKTIPTEMLKYLKTWLVEHIIKSDGAYKSFFQQKGLS